MDLAQLVRTDELYDLTITNPVTGKKTDVVFQLRSMESDEVKAVARKHANRMMRNRQAVPNVEQLEADILDQTTAAVASWDWGENTLGDLDLTFSADNVRAALQAHGWIFDQVRGAAEARENFTAKP